MAMKFTQGADSALVTAATRAGMATAPADYSKTFQATADSYAESMQATANMWKEIMNAGAKIGGQIMKKKQENDLLEQEVKDTPFADFYLPELESIKSANKAGLGIGKGKFNEDGDWIPFSDEEGSSWVETFGADDTETTRLSPLSKEARELRKRSRGKKNDLFKKLTLASTDFANIEALVSTPGSINWKHNDPVHLELVNSLLASKSGGKTPKGNYLVPKKATENIGMNIKKGDWYWEMWNDPAANTEKLSNIAEVDPKKKADTEAIMNSQEAKESGATPITGGDGKPLTFKVGEIQNLLVKNNPDMPKAFRKIGQGLIANGKALGGNYSDKNNSIMRSDVETSVEDLVKTRDGLRQGVHEKIGHNSFFDDVTKMGGGSAQIFKSLQSIAPLNADKTLQAEGPLAALDEMTDGKKGISQQDLTSPTNMAIIQQALFTPSNPNYNEEFTRGTLINWAVNRYGDYYNTGSNRKPKDNNGKKTDRIVKINSKLNTLGSVVKRGKPYDFSLQGGNLKITIDPVKGEIRQTFEGKTSLLHPQKFLDAFLGDTGVRDAGEIFGKGWFNKDFSAPQGFVMPYSQNFLDQFKVN